MEQNLGNRVDVEEFKSFLIWQQDLHSTIQQQGCLKAGNFSIGYFWQNKKVRIIFPSDFGAVDFIYVGEPRVFHLHKLTSFD